VAAQTACWTLCSSVTCSGTTPDKNGQTYKETTGSCCQAATVTCTSPKVNVNGICKTPCKVKSCLTSSEYVWTGYAEDAPDGNCCICPGGRVPYGPFSGWCCSSPEDTKQPVGGGSCSWSSNCGGMGGSCCYNNLLCEMVSRI
ncbi:MAG: hypothetical protein LBI01_05345, partial [Elusimicrobium sp.]|nr:hypothetical protein [Elusimicrobium sp.]